MINKHTWLTILSDTFPRILFVGITLFSAHIVSSAIHETDLDNWKKEINDIAIKAAHTLEAEFTKQQRLIGYFSHDARLFNVFASEEKESIKALRRALFEFQYVYTPQSTHIYRFEDADIIAQTTSMDKIPLSVLNHLTRGVENNISNMTDLILSTGAVEVAFASLIVSETGAPHGYAISTQKLYDLIHPTRPTLERFQDVSYSLYFLGDGSEAIHFEKIHTDALLPQTVAKQNMKRPLFETPFPTAVYGTPGINAELVAMQRLDGFNKWAVAVHLPEKFLGAPSSLTRQFIWFSATIISLLFALFPYQKKGPISTLTRGIYVLLSKALYSIKLPKKNSLIREKIGSIDYDTSPFPASQKHTASITSLSNVNSDSTTKRTTQYSNKNTRNSLKKYLKAATRNTDNEQGFLNETSPPQNAVISPHTSTQQTMYNVRNIFRKVVGKPPHPRFKNVAGTTIIQTTNAEGQQRISLPKMASKKDFLQNRPAVNIQQNTQPVLDEKMEPSRNLISFYIHQGIKEKKLKLQYQPIFDTRTQAPAMHETYMRIVTDRGDIIPPPQWLPVAKKENLFADIDETVLTQTVDHFFNSPQNGGENLPFTFNISGNTFHRMTFIEKITAAGDSTAEHIAKNTIFEMRSMEVLQDPAARQFMREATKNFFRFSMDYFGGGAKVVQASKKIGFSFIKLDAFKRDIHNPEDKKLIRDLAHACQNEGLPLIVERIESADVVKFCEDINVPYVQGFFLKEPEETLTKETENYRLNFDKNAR